MGVLGKRLREARQFRNITQEQLAEKADITRAMIGRYETTDQMPSLDTLLRISDALDVSTDFLLGRTDSIAHTNMENCQNYTPVADIKSSKVPKNRKEMENLIRTIVFDILVEKKLLDHHS